MKVQWAVKFTAMTALSSVLALSLGACAASGAARAVSSAAAMQDDAPIRGRVAVLTVYGMSCPLCAHNVDKVLLEVPGVIGVRVDMATGEATVDLDGKTSVTRRQLAQAVDKSGFSLQRIEVP